MGSMQERGTWILVFVVLFGGMLSGMGLPGGYSAWAAGELQAAWMKGASVADQDGVYGELGTPDPANTPGARRNAVSWTDAEGALWLFGGSGYTLGGSGVLNDLWKYDRSTGNWAWMQGSSSTGQSGSYGSLGVPAKENTPGGRQQSVSWVDGYGKLWLFGGMGLDGAGSFGSLNDLWRFDPDTGTWTWMNGSSTKDHAGVYPAAKSSKVAIGPGARYDAVSWVDPVGSLYLFGGFGFDGSGGRGYLNDLWRCDKDTGLWTWAGGSSTVNPAGSYGTVGVSSPGNVPGGRQGAVGWVDNASRTAWLFGGFGNDGVGNQGHLNDMWRYNIALAQWTWVKGSSLNAAAGTYGALGTTAPANTPGARYDAMSFKDASGFLWLFGGTGWDGAGGAGYLNDLWRFDRTSGNWTWMKGSSAQGASGTYGVMGTPASANMPGARYQAVSWSDETGALWLMGGDGNDGTGSGGYLNDLWKWPDTLPPTGSVIINGNQSVTNNRNVTLSLKWEDAAGTVSRMKFSNDGTTWTAWESLAETKAWTLPAGEGYKTVRVMFRDASGNNSAVCTDYIRVDTIPPTGSIIINGGASSTTNRVVSLGLTWSDGSGSGVTRMRFSLDGAHWTAWEPQVTPKSYTLPSAPGYYTVRVTYRDAGGNISERYSDYIKLLAP